MLTMVLYEPPGVSRDWTSEANEVKANDTCCGVSVGPDTLTRLANLSFAD